jgi:hypothetical protein
MKKIIQLFTASLLVLLTLAASAQQFSKADNAVISNYPLTIEKVNQYMLF